MAFKLRNFSVESFNRDVNQSGDLQRKYTAWSGYRETISALIGEALALHPQVSCALVLAAGNLNDIDLRFLCGRLSALTLSDADVDAIRQGIDRQNLSDAERVKLTVVQSDYTGAMQQKLFDELEARARRRVPAAALASYIQTAVSQLLPMPVQGLSQRYPLVISCPVYTQLLYTQVEVFLKLLYEAQLYSLDDLNLILNAAYGAMPGILSRYNTLLLNACEPDGLIVLLSDMVEMEAGSQAYSDASQTAKDGHVSPRNAEALIEAHGAELSVVGLQNFQERAHILQQQYLLWPFDEEKSYLVSAVLARPFDVYKAT